MSQEHQRKVSIVLPTYNGEKYLNISIESCLAQSYRNIELIIVDDCSTDSTPRIVQSFNDSRIKYIRNTSNKRLPQSLNIGFAASTGDYLTWTSDDNLYRPDAIEKMAAALESNAVNFVYADYSEFKNDNISDANLRKLSESRAITTYNCIGACFLYTQKVFKTVGNYDQDMELIEDYDYWMRVNRYFSLHHLNEGLYYYRLHDNSLWGSRKREIRMAEVLFKLKYNLVNIDNANFMIKDFMICGTRGRIPPFIIKVFVNLRFSTKIKTFLKMYKSNQLSFTQTRVNLYHLINTYLP